MTTAAEKLVTNLERAAEATREAETLLRKTMAEEIARAERERVFAFRRARLVGLLVSCAREAENEPAAIAAQAQAVCQELRLSTGNAAHKEILDRLAPVGAAIWLCACEPSGDDDSETAGRSLLEFEAWFENARGQPFYALFEREALDLPLVDF